MSLIKNYQLLSRTGGKGNIQVAGTILLEALIGAPDHKLSAQTILSRYWNDIDVKMLDDLSATFEAAGLTQSTVSSGKLAIQLTKHGLTTMGLGLNGAGPGLG
jgi:hypothetical protein